jgi:hypothetical protein
MWIKFKDIGCLVAERAFFTVVPSSITRNKDKTAGRQNATRRFFIFRNIRVYEVSAPVISRHKPPDPFICSVR